MSVRIALSPASSKGTRRARHRLAMWNDGADTVSVDLLAADPELRVDADVEPAAHVLGPGATATSAVVVRVHRRAVLRTPEPVRVVVTATVAGSERVETAFTFQQSRSLGTLAALALAVVVLATGAVAGIDALLNRGGDDDRTPVQFDVAGPASTSLVAPLPTAPSDPSTTTTTAAPRPAVVRDELVVAVVREGVSILELVAAEGSRAARLTEPPLPAFEPAWSPDRTKVAFTACASGCGTTAADFDIAVVDVATRAIAVIAGGPSSSTGPTWSPDGARLAFSDDRSGSLELWSVAATGGEPTRLTDLGARSANPAWSPDGTRIAFSNDRSGNPDLYVLTLADGAVTPLTAAPGADDHPAWSPDGTSIAFDSDRLGQPDVFVVASAGGAPRRLTTSLDAEVEPTWSPDGTRLAIVSGRGNARDLQVLALSGGAPRLVRADVSPEAAPDWG